MSKILIEGNKVIIDGHSSDLETCNTLTNLCDELSTSDKFRTVRYESGYGEFESVSENEEKKFIIIDEIEPPPPDPGSGYQVNIKSNDGTTILAQYDDIDYVVVTSVGAQFRGINTFDAAYTYSGSKLFAGLATSANALVAKYKPGDMIYTTAETTLYIVENIIIPDSYSTLTALFSDIATVIREKTGDASAIIANDFPAMIRESLHGSGDSLATPIIDRTIREITNSSIETIGNCAFAYCSSLTSVSFPACTSIGSYAFSRCSSLTSVSFPVCTSINEYAFANCTNLASVSFPVCTRIGLGAFSLCISLASVSFPECTIINDSAFTNCTSLTSVSFPVCTSIGLGAFAYCDSLASVSFPVCTSIGRYAFSHCSSLTSVSFPVCTSINGYAFAYCTNLASVSFPECTIIKESAFSNCSSLTSVSFPVCTSIGRYAFRSCFSLTSVSFPMCTIIESFAFVSCYNLISLTLGAPSVCSLPYSNAFVSTPIGGYSASAGRYGSIFVPASLLASYKAAKNWSYFSSRFVGY